MFSLTQARFLNSSHEPEYMWQLRLDGEQRLRVAGVDRSCAPRREPVRDPVGRVAAGEI
jgi:hypothetical protein